MVLSKYKDLFFSLSTPVVDEITPYALLPYVLERQIASLDGGLDLSKKKKLEGLSGKTLKYYKERVPGYKLRSTRDLNLSPNIAKIQQPCAMKVESIAQLMQEVMYIYQIAYAHYIVGMNEMPGFPNYCCGDAGRNVLASSWMLGYPNATYVLDDPDDHGYNAFPFIITNLKTEGVIVVDPTSDQLWNGNHTSQKPRNMILITPGTSWDYETNWRYGNNLYPTVVFHIGNFHEQGRIKSDVDYMTPIDTYFNSVFKNPIDLTTLG